MLSTLYVPGLRLTRCLEKVYIAEPKNYLLSEIMTMRGKQVSRRDRQRPGKRRVDIHRLVAYLSERRISLISYFPKLIALLHFLAFRVI